MVEGTPMLGMSHVAFCVRNLNRSLEFYRDLLGFRVVKDALQNTSTGGFRIYTRIDTCNGVWSISKAPSEQPFRCWSSPSTRGTRSEESLSGSIRWASAISRSPWRGRCSRAALACSGGRDLWPSDAFKDAQGRIRTVFFRDPDGILVQFDEGLE